MYIITPVSTNQTLVFFSSDDLYISHYFIIPIQACHCQYLDFHIAELYNTYMELSIVFGTYNRFNHLAECILTIREFVKRDYEIIVADGGSIDGSREWLVKQQDTIMIGERSLNGAVDAYNKAFSIASGKYVAHLNDDCHIQDECLDAACDILDAHADVGQVAIPYIDMRGDPILNRIHMWKGDVLYANFGVLRRSLGDKIGWWGNYLHTYGGDCECSFKIWEAGFKVVPLHGHAIFHHRHKDALRRNNTESHKFFMKWERKVNPIWGDQ
jgi:GT2 family glycosyltransferase